MKEEDKIIRKCGNGNPFTVPEDYFNNLTQDVMNRLPEKEISDSRKKKITTWEKIRPWLYMAAMFTGILLSIRLMINTSTDRAVYAEVSGSENEFPSDEYIESMMEHSMIDDYTLYQYLTDADTDRSHN